MIDYSVMIRTHGCRLLYIGIKESVGEISALGKELYKLTVCIPLSSRMIQVTCHESCFGSDVIFKLLCWFAPRINARLILVWHVPLRSPLGHLWTWAVWYPRDMYHTRPIQSIYPAIGDVLRTYNKYIDGNEGTEPYIYETCMHCIAFWKK